jgi:hypothetical protein
VTTPQDSVKKSINASDVLRLIKAMAVIEQKTSNPTVTDVKKTPITAVVVNDIDSKLATLEGKALTASSTGCEGAC